MQIPNPQKLIKQVRLKLKKDSYPIIAVVRSRRQGGSVVRIDRMKRVSRTTYQMLSNKHIFEAPEMSEVDILVGGGNFVELWNPEHKVYIPLTFKEDPNNPILKEASTNYLNWAKEKTREIRLRHITEKSKLEEYMPLVLPMITAISVGIILWMASENWRQIEPITHTLKTMVDVLKGVTSTSGALTPVG